MTPTEAKAKYQDDLIQGFKSLLSEQKELKTDEEKTILSLFDKWTEQSDEHLSNVIAWATVRKQWWHVDAMYRVCSNPKFDFSYDIPLCLEGKDVTYGMLLIAIAISIVEKRSRQIITDTAWEVFDSVVFGEN